MDPGCRGVSKGKNELCGRLEGGGSLPRRLSCGCQGLRHQGGGQWATLSQCWFPAITSPCSGSPPSLREQTLAMSVLPGCSILLLLLPQAQLMLDTVASTGPVGSAAVVCVQ